MKRCLLVVLVLSLLLLTGCRTRVTSSLAPERRDAAYPGQLDGAGADRDGSADQARTQDAHPTADAAPGAMTTEDPTADRREYDDQAPARVQSGADHLLHQEGEGAGSPGVPEGAAPSADQLRDESSRTAIQMLPAEEADRLGTSQDAPDADSALTYYTVLLHERVSAMFECQRLELYLEMPEDYRTIHKSSQEHQLILQAGCYDVSARLLEENLTVDAGWVQRKDPGVIVKVVERSVLGEGVVGTSAAKAVLASLGSRPDWSNIAAVKHGRVLLLSRQLLETATLRTYAALAIAKTAAPEQFADVDLPEALRRLADETPGFSGEGVLTYLKE